MRSDLLISQRALEASAAWTNLSSSASRLRGQQVVFCAGPLKGLGSIISSSAAVRVQVLISLLGREQTVAVKVGDLAFA